MDENVKSSIESLLERITVYGKTNYKIVKLTIIDKVSDILSSLIPLIVICILIGSFLVFINVGLALWLGEILGEVYYGFFAVGAFYGLITIIFSLFMNKWVKRVFYDYFVRKIIKSDKE
ncbi:MAG: hypothetical protein PHO12_05780 [Bacteroidales bacterium]|nr:hypothetical protein [Bacteroidales bacterium]MDD4683607.1 hypothetical protein [Bacteroidales bacterium]